MRRRLVRPPSPCEHEPARMRDAAFMTARAGFFAAVLVLVPGCGDDVTVRVAAARQQVPYRDWALRTCTPWVRVDVQLPGASPAEIERSIVEPIEASIATLPGVREIASRASHGGATVWAATENDPMGSVSWAIAGALSDPSRLAADAKLASVAYDSPWLHTHVVAVGSDGDPSLAEESAGALLDRLRPGARHVAWVGAPPRVLTVRIDPVRLQALGLEVAHVEGKLRTAHWDLPRRHAGGGIDPSRLPELRIVERPDGTTIRLVDVATIAEERGDGPPAPRLSGHAVTVLIASVQGREGVAHAVQSGTSAPQVQTTIVGAASSSACLHPLRPASIEGGLQAVAVALRDGGESAYALAERFPGGLWLFDQPDVFAGPGGTRRDAQWLAGASTTPPDLGRVPNVAIVGRAAPGLAAITIAIAGADRDALRSTADTLRAALSGRGEEVLADPPARTIVSLQPSAAARAAGVGAADLEAARSRSRDVPGITTWSGRPIRLVVGDEPSTDVERVEDVPVPLPAGGTAPLSTLADARAEPAMDLWRLDRTPVLLLHVVTRDLASTRATIDAELKAMAAASSSTARVVE
jgi:multidrug efflux pump subunit AcrB